MFPYLKKDTQNIYDKGLWRSRLTARPLSCGKILLNNHEYLNFCSNDYLDLSHHHRIKKVMKSHIQKYGFGSSASPLLAGYSFECEELEKTFCRILGFEDALIFPSGYQANIGVLSSLITKSSRVICDRFCHASILDGILLSGAKIKRFKHNDSAHAAKLIKANSPNLLITERLFSMEGDIAPLDELCSLCRHFSLPFFVDDAHGFGVLDTHNDWKLKKIKPDILCIPFGKALGLNGAIVLGTKNIIDLILQFCRSYRYSTAISPAICMGVLESLDILHQEEWRLEKLKKLIYHFNTAALEVGLPLLSKDITPIRSILIGDTHKAVAVSKHLRNKGIYAPALLPPTIPKNASRIRLSLTCAHHICDIDYLITTLKEAIT
ncbi:MAG: 8-amino-7-oxononanoate synthase [Alphaproteobacteria bacterium]|nr:8-amino-7-oxononanoate synthase [Alphaproteobacteria bacterium]